jgi:hypothetical protein
MTTPLPQMSAAEYRTPKNEKELQAQIKKTAKDLGWKVFHSGYAPGADRGYPDLTLIHEFYIPIWMELKGPNPKIYPEQREWLAAINAADGRLGLMVFPDDLDAVCALLAGSWDVEFYNDTKLGVRRVRLIEET